MKVTCTQCTLNGSAANSDNTAVNLQNVPLQQDEMGDWQERRNRQHLREELERDISQLKHNKENCFTNIIGVDSQGKQHWYHCEYDDEGKAHLEEISDNAIGEFLQAAGEKKLTSVEHERDH